MKNTVKKTKNAQTKAWETRKANEASMTNQERMILDIIRSEAGRKAVATKKAKALFAKRSASAKKAWNTRRASA